MDVNSDSPIMNAKNSYVHFQSNHPNLRKHEALWGRDNKIMQIAMIHMWSTSSDVDGFVQVCALGCILKGIPMFLGGGKGGESRLKAAARRGSFFGRKDEIGWGWIRCAKVRCAHPILSAIFRWIMKKWIGKRKRDKKGMRNELSHLWFRVRFPHSAL